MAKKRRRKQQKNRNGSRYKPRQVLGESKQLSSGVVVAHVLIGEHLDDCALCRVFRSDGPAAS